MTRPVLFHGGRIHVGDGTTADGLVARDGRVLAVGRATDLAREHRDAERIDIGGGLMVPGWVDAHVHFMWWSLQRSQVDLRDAATLEAALAKIAAYAKGLPPGAWVLGGRFDKNRWGRWPTKDDLDRVTRGRPAALRSRDGHSRWLNTEALRRAGIGASTKAPPGGEIERDAAGSPTGVLKENANWLADRVVPPPTDDECLAALRAGQRDALADGITGIEDLEDAAAFAAWRRLREAGELVLRVAMGIPYRRTGATDGAPAAPRPLLALEREPAPRAVPAASPGSRHDFESALAEGLRTGTGDEWLEIGHLKIFTDGALGSQTAALVEPYEGSDGTGILTIDPAQLTHDVSKAAAAGIAVAIHAIGDRAVQVALDAIEPTRKWAPALRQKVEHVQLVREQDLGRFGALGIVASMQPIHATSDRDLADRYWGERRTKRAYPWRTLTERGATLAFGSDAPVEPIAPLVGIHAAVARTRPGDAKPWHQEQALTLDEALAAYSAGAAYALGREREAGTLAPGMRADATVLDHDLARLPVDRWLETKVRATVTAGAVRYDGGLS
ncbi:MAG TPA: amidohydrolase [Candidatus Limnocylindria bacterium]|nr:amidohydrolase [Candidatus Limnocylindria bacterium]